MANSFIKITFIFPFAFTGILTCSVCQAILANSLEGREFFNKTQPKNLWQADEHWEYCFSWRSGWKTKGILWRWQYLWGGAGLPSPRADAVATSSCPDNFKELSTLPSLFLNLFAWETLWVAFSYLLSGHLRGSLCLCNACIQVLENSDPLFRDVLPSGPSVTSGSIWVFGDPTQCHVLFMWIHMYSSIYSQIDLRVILRSASKQRTGFFLNLCEA